MSRLDELRSLMRGAIRSAGNSIEKVGKLNEARRVLRELANQRLLVPDSAVGAAVARAHGVESASARSHEGALYVDAYFTDGEHLEARFEPGLPTFAPRGPKELVWDVSPPEALASRHLLDVTSALSTAVATTLWAVVLPRDLEDIGSPIVDRDGTSRLRVDLRTVPALRELAQKGSIAAIIEVLELGGIECADGEMRLQLKLPGFS
ncbi:MAG: hypothetical protein H5U40_12490 [Polyangiaceae bacterium]|nr:hypothetical protein [Polyangiaceae bacterium]